MADWDRYFQLLGIQSESDSLQSPNEVTPVTATSDRDISDWIFSNVTGDLKGQQTPTAYYRVSPSLKMLNLNPPFDVGISNWGVAELIDASPSVERTPILLIGSESITLDQGHPISEGSTEGEDSTLHLEEQLVNYLDKLVHEAADEVFSDGMESVFSQRISLAVENYGNIAVRAIDRLINFDRTNVEAVGEILRQMGSMEDLRTHRSRLTILMSNLQSPDPRIRDAASLGLAALDDPAAIDAVRRTLDQESSFQLRRNLRLVMDQLQSTRWQVS